MTGSCGLGTLEPDGREVDVGLSRVEFGDRGGDVDGDDLPVIGELARFPGLGPDGLQRGQVGEVGCVLPEQTLQGGVVVEALVDHREGGDDREDQGDDREDAQEPVGPGPAQDDDDNREPHQPGPQVEGLGNSSGTRLKTWMARAVRTVSTKLTGIPIGSCHFHAPSCQPTDKTTDTMATMTTVAGTIP